MYGNVKVLVLVLILDQKVLGTWQVIFKYYLLKSVKVAKYLNTLLLLSLSVANPGGGPGGLAPP